MKRPHPSSPEEKASSRALDADRIPELFDLTRNLPPARRSSLLVRRTNGNVRLRAELESLLRAHDRAHDFLEPPPAEWGAALPGILLPPRRRTVLDQLAQSYELLTCLGVGRFGATYKIRHRATDQPRVARIVAAGPPMRDRLLYEARRTMDLNHPGLVRIHDVAADETGPVGLISDFVLGRDLSEVLAQRRPLDMDLALEVGGQVLSCLDHLHRRGIVHSGLGPSSIKITMADDGRPRARLVDLGVTARAGLRRHPDPYAPPEVSLRSAPDSRHDLYAVGAILHSALGRQILDEELEQVLERARSSRPDCRYPSALSFRLDLSRIARRRSTAVYLSRVRWVKFLGIEAAPSPNGRAR